MTTAQQTFKYYLKRVTAIFCKAFPVADADDWVFMSPRHRPCSEIIGVRVCRPSVGLCWTPAQGRQDELRVPSSAPMVQLLQKDRPRLRVLYFNKTNTIQK